MTHRFVRRNADLPFEALAQPAIAIAQPGAWGTTFLLHEPAASARRPQPRILVSAIGNEFAVLRIRHECGIDDESRQAHGMGAAFIIETEARCAGRRADRDRTAGKTDLGLRSRPRTQLFQPGRCRHAQRLQGIGKGVGMHVFVRQDQAIRIQGCVVGRCAGKPVEDPVMHFPAIGLQRATTGQTQAPALPMRHRVRVEPVIALGQQRIAYRAGRIARLGFAQHVPFGKPGQVAEFPQWRIDH